MADDMRGRPLAPREYAAEYPPPPGEEDERARSYQLPPVNAGGSRMTLPPMNEAYGSGSFPPADRYPPPPERVPDPRMQGGYSPSPTNGGGYPQPPMPPNPGNGYAQQPPTSNGYGPPPGPPPVGPRPPSYGGGDPRNYAQEPRPAYGQEQRPPYPPDNRQYYPPPPPQQGPPRPPSYGPGPSAPPPGYGPGNGPEQAGPSYYPPPNPAGYPGGPMYPGLTSAQSPQHSAQAAAPRQRTSIACRYCRKRKIRCSGYQNTADGKCTNCKKTGNECVFQPVSNNASTAFVPVSAVPGGVPPGTPLYGAFGQPLNPQQPGGPPPPPPPPQGYPPQQPQGYAQGPPPPQDYPMQSPTTSSYYPPPDDRAPQGVRRPRAPDDEGMRLPPPRPFTGDDRDSREPRDPRRLSPASTQSNNTTPPGYNYYANRNGEYEGEPSSAPRGESSPGGYSPGGQSSANGANPMSLGSLMDSYPPPPGQRDSGSKGDIDSNMLGRLNRKT